MKSPRPRICLIDTAEPLLCFNGLVMRCGKILSQAEIVWMVRDDYRDFGMNPEYSSQLCRRCWEAGAEPEPVPGEKSYSYACVEGQEQTLTDEGAA
jgi:hypothetical protein